MFLLLTWLFVAAVATEHADDSVVVVFTDVPARLFVSLPPLHHSVPQHRQLQSSGERAHTHTVR